MPSGKVNIPKGQSDADTAIHELILGRLDACVDAKHDRLEEAMVVLMAYSGFSIDKARDFAKAHTQEQLPNWFTDRIVLNVLQPIARTAASILAANNPTWIVEPMGDSPSKYQAARGVNKLLEYFYRSNDISALLDDVVLRSALIGYAGMFVDWDSSVGVGAFQDKNYGRHGWFNVEPVDIFNLHFEPGVGGVDKSFWAVRETTMHIEEARYYFNNGDISDVYDDDTVKRQLEIVSNLEGPNTDIHEMSDRVRVLHYWQRPGYSHPDGLEVIIAGDTIVEVRDRLLMGEFPVYMMRFMSEPYRDYGSGLGNTLLQLQRDLTMTWNGYRARRDQEVRPPWFVPVGSTTRGINTFPGAVNELNPRAPAPSPVRFDPFSQAVSTFGDQTLQAMEYVAGINDASRGEAPTSNATGRLTAFLAELDNRKLGPTVRSMSRMLANVGKRMVRLWQEFGTDSITVTVLGNGHSAEVSEIRRDEVLWQDIDVEVASLMPRTQPLRQETILNLLQMGIVDKQKALDALEFGGFDEAVGFRSMESLNARAKAEMIADISIPIEEINVWEEEDHEIHVRELVKYVLLEDPGKLIRARFETIIAAHREMMNRKKVEGAQMANAAKDAEGMDMAIAGGAAVPGGLPPDMMSLQEPGVDTGAEAALASMAGIE